MKPTPASRMASWRATQTPGRSNAPAEIKTNIAPRHSRISSGPTDPIPTTNGPNIPSVFRICSRNSSSWINYNIYIYIYIYMKRSRTSRKTPKRTSRKTPKRTSRKQGTRRSRRGTRTHRSLPKRTKSRTARRRSSRRIHRGGMNAAPDGPFRGTVIAEINPAGMDLLAEINPAGMDIPGPLPTLPSELQDMNLPIRIWYRMGYVFGYGFESTGEIKQGNNCLLFSKSGQPDDEEWHQVTQVKNRERKMIRFRVSPSIEEYPYKLKYTDGSEVEIVFKLRT
jgi:hypothetical protein